MQYKAFLSYSHAADERLGAILQSALQRFAKPWYRLRAITLFRDKTGLAVSPALWPSIEAALQASEFFVLMASPRAAASPWVVREVEWWCANRSVDTLLIVVTDGTLVWADGDFDWEQTDALPRILQHALRHEPLYLDLRWARSAEALSLRNPRFREAVAQLAAPLHRLSKDALIGEDVRQHRRTRRVAWAAGVLLVLLTMASLTAGWMAREQRNRAAQERSEAERLIQFMLFDLRDKLEPIGRLDLLEEVNRRTHQYYQAFPVMQDDAERRYQRAVALANAAEYLRRRGDSAEALRTATESRQLMKQTADRNPRSVQAQRHLAVATIELAHVHQELGDLVLAEELMRSAAGALESLRRAGADDRLMVDLANGQLALGTLLHERQDPAAIDSVDQALAMYRDLGSRNPADVQWRRRTADALNARGAMLRDLARLPDALRSYTESYEIARQLSDQDSSDMHRRHDVAMAHGARARVLADQGQIARAQQELSTKRQILQRLVDHDPANAFWQLDLADTDRVVGTLLARLGRIEDAVHAHREAITRLEQLVAFNTRNPTWSLELASAHNALGDAQFSAGRFEDGIKAYLASLRVMEDLAKRHPDHLRVQRAKAIAYTKAAQIYSDGVNDHSAALTLYQSVIATFEQMTRDNPRNVVAQDDLAVAQEQLARMHANAGRLDESAAAFRAALAIRIKLSASDPSHLRWQGNVITLQHATGSAWLAQGDVQAAADLFSDALLRSQQLANADPDEVSWHSLAAVSHERLGAVHRMRRDRDRAVASYRRALASMREVARLSPASADAQRNLELIQQQIAMVLSDGNTPERVPANAR